MVAAFSALQVVLALVTAPADTCGSRYTLTRYRLLNWHVDPSWLDSCEAALAAPAWPVSENEERLELRARLLMVRGDREANPKARVRWYAAARAAAESLRAADELNPAGHVWWAAAHGRVLEARGMVSAAKGAAALRRENERALELDPDCALANYALGRMYEALPGLLGGGLRKAESRYRRAVESDPNYTTIRLALARVLLRLGRSEEARAELKQLLAIVSPTNPAEAALADRPTAVALLDSLGGDQGSQERESGASN